MAVLKLEKVGVEVNWPKGEKIPESLEEAIKLRWKVTGSEGTGPDEFSDTGEAHLQKTTRTHRLYLSIPYRANFAYGKPHSSTRLLPRGVATTRQRVSLKVWAFTVWATSARRCEVRS